jgi:hypothetical protein
MCHGRRKDSSLDREKNQRATEGEGRQRRQLRDPSRKKGGCAV